MEILIKVLQFVVSFSILVLVHEFGHFFFAKLFKARVEKFYLFFNPWFSLFKFKRGDTEYGVGWVPVGGYCKIAGMVDESMDTDSLKSEPQPWEFRSKPAWQRLLIIVGGVLMNILLAIGIYIGVTYAWGDSYIKTADVKEGFAYSELAQEMGFRDGDRVLSVGGQYIENFQQIPAAILLEEENQVVVDRDGERVTLPIDPSFIKRMLKDKHFIDLRYPFLLADVLPDGAARAAGLQAGDSLTSVDGVAMTYYDQFRSVFTSHKQDTLQLGFVRAGVAMELPVVVSDQGLIGAMAKGPELKNYPVSTKTYNFWQSIPAGFKRAVASIDNYLKQLKLIFSPDTEAYKSVGGLIAMGNIFPGQWDWISFWHITALFSIMLAVLNILPIPLLDGGHVVFILYEMITGRTPSDKFMERAQLFGMVLVFGVIILANGNDLLKLIFG